MSNIRICEIGRKKIKNGENNTKLIQVPPNIITCLDENVSTIIATWNPDLNEGSFGEVKHHPS